MKRLLLIIAFLLIPMIVCSAPFLVSDPSPSPIATVEVEITTGGVTTVTPGTYIVVGTDARLLDLTDKPNGSYVFKVRWSDASGWWSDWSDPLTAVKSGKPGNFRIK